MRLDDPAFTDSDDSDEGQSDDHGIFRMHDMRDSLSPVLCQVINIQFLYHE